MIRVIPHGLLLSALLFSGPLAVNAAGAPPAFAPPINYATGGLDTIFPNTGGPIWVSVADVNGDGHLDVLVANWCQSVSACTKSNVGVLLNRGDGTFNAVVPYDTGGQHAFSVSVVDMNGDGIPDLVVANGCGSAFQVPGGCPDGLASVLLGNGDGTFQAARTFPSGGALSALLVADLNGDGHPDVVVSNCAPTGQLCPSAAGNVGVLLGNGDGTLQAVAIYESGGLAATYVAVADVNGDQRPDVLVSNQRVCDNCRGNLGVLMGRGDGTLQAVQTYDTGLFAPASIATTDLNGDHRVDLVLTQNIGGGGELAVLLNRGDGTFQTATVYESGGLYATPLVIADTNGDGKPDLLVSHSQFCTGRSPNASCIGVLLGTGDGTFQPAVTYDSGGTGAWSLTAADFNGDGRIDVAVAHQCRLTGCTQSTGIVGVLAGNGDGSFQPPRTYDTHAASVLAVAADLNGDTQPDLLIGNAPASPSGSIDVLLNDTTPADTAPPSITVKATPNSLWPPNGTIVPVTVTGAVTDTGSGVDRSSVVFSVSDEYGEIQRTGAVSLASNGTYSFIVPLVASRRGSDADGRHFTVTIRAKDNAGNAGSAATVVTVPHDRRR